MRLRALALAIAAFASAGAGAWFIGGVVADRLEARAEAALVAAWEAAGLDWPRVEADGLIVRLGGEAPDEAARFHALEIARQVIDLGRIEDAIAVARAEPGAPPDFALDIMLGDGEANLIGLVPETSRARLADAIRAAGSGGAATAMVETAAHPAPPGWEPALDYALSLVGLLPRARISVAPGAVGYSGFAEDEAARAALERRLRRALPEGVALDLDLSAPRPVIAPFALAFRIDADGRGHLAACSAETEAVAEAIRAAAMAAGAGKTEDCRIGLGAPAASWEEAARLGIGTVAAMGGGSFSLSDLEALLVGPPDLDPEALAAAGAALAEALPAPFVLTTRGARTRPGGPDGAERPVPDFRATLGPDGALTLAGPVADPSSRIAVLGFAQALFGHDGVHAAIVLDPHLPEGWPGRVLQGIEALALLEEGELMVTDAAITLAGRSMSEHAEEEVAAFFDGRGLGPVHLDIAFDEAAAAALAEARAAERAAIARRAADAAAAALRETCAAGIGRILAEEMILFEPGSAVIDAESEDVIAAIAATLAACPGARFEVSGHTDSQGGADLNQRLSEERAAAVAEALAADLPAIELVPVGFGPDRPIADNDTPEGRALNRRIEFLLLPGTAGGSGAEPDETAEAPGPAQGGGGNGPD
jgi:OOP family OmpA-OmpF porin